MPEKDPLNPSGEDLVYERLTSTKEEFDALQQIRFHMRRILTGDGNDSKEANDEGGGS